MKRATSRFLDILGGHHAEAVALPVVVIRLRLVSSQVASGHPFRMTCAAAIRTSVEPEKSMEETPGRRGRRKLVLARYEIRIGGRLDERATAAFAGLDVAARGSVTVIRGEFDQAGLHGVLERIRFLGLDLVEVRRVRGSPRSP